MSRSSRHVIQRREIISVLRCQKRLHEAISRLLAVDGCGCTLCPSSYGMRWSIDENFRSDLTVLGRLVVTCIFRGGPR